jgi:hypothetical protein
MSYSGVVEEDDAKRGMLEASATERSEIDRSGQSCEANFGGTMKFSPSQERREAEDPQASRQSRRSSTSPPRIPSKPM